MDCLASGIGFVVEMDMDMDMDADLVSSNCVLIISIYFGFVLLFGYQHTIYESTTKMLGFYLNQNLSFILIWIIRNPGKYKVQPMDIQKFDYH